MSSEYIRFGPRTDDFHPIMHMKQLTLCPGAYRAEADLRGATYDVFIDLSGAGLDRAALDEHIDRLASDAGLAGTACQVTLVLPGHSAPLIVPSALDVDVSPARSAAAGLARAVSRATASRRHLVVLFGAITPGKDVLSLLIEAFDRDPLFGTTQPRFAESGTDRIWSLPGTVDDKLAGPQSARAILPYLSFGVTTPELLAACLVLRWNVLAAIDGVDHAYASTEGALLQLLCQARRRGLRNFVVNRAVVESSLNYPALYPVPPCGDLDCLRAAYPETARVETEVARLTQRRLEPLLTAVHSGIGGQPNVLLDCRGMLPLHNGTTRCTLGLLDGFAALGNVHQIDILVSRPAAAFHRLTQRYPRFRQLHDHPTGAYAAAVLMNQPWSLGTVAELHRHALIVVFNMLDTIMWDILYVAPKNLESVWRFIARHADGLLYISYFTRERFNTRFPVRSDVQERVMHLSFKKEEQSDPAVRTVPVSDHILIIGNDYDHKDVQRTLQVLVDGFPFNRIVAVGAKNAPTPNVVAIPSGDMEQRELHRLIASAKVVVFPSYYEGFGLPAVEGLAYGRPVLVRSSPLWTEIAAWSQLPGQLIEFDDAASLIEGVGRVIAGLPCHALPSGVALTEGAAVAGWRECAQNVIALVDDCIASADGTRWLERDEALCAVEHYDFYN
jgi:glycosyltransferase involved in cell wall biosynthesis